MTSFVPAYTFFFSFIYYSEICCPFYGMHSFSGRVPAYFIPPPPLAGPLFPEKTKKGHYNSRVVLKPQPELTPRAAPSQQQLPGKSRSSVFSIVLFFFPSWAKIDLFLFCDGLLHDSPLSFFVFIPSAHLSIVEANSSEKAETNSSAPRAGKPASR